MDISSTLIDCSYGLANSNRVSELRVVELLDGLCEKMQDYTLEKVISIFDATMVPSDTILPGKRNIFHFVVIVENCFGFTSMFSMQRGSAKPEWVKVHDWDKMKDSMFCIVPFLDKFILLSSYPAKYVN